MTFSNLTFNRGTLFTIESNTTLTTSGTLTLTDGTVTSGTIAAQGDVSLGTGFDGGLTPLLINGTGDQIFTGAGSTTSGSCLPLVINKAGGTLTLANIIRTGNDWTYTAGDVDAGTSTVIFAVKTLTITGSMTFSNIIFNRGTIFTIDSNTTVTTSGTLSLTDGTINSGTLAAQGGVTAGTLFDGGSTVLLINGAGDQILTGGGSTTTGDFLPLEINKTGGTLTIASILRTGYNWTYTAGNVDAGTSTVIFARRSLTIKGSMTFSNVTFNGGTIFTVDPGTTLTTSGTLWLNNGSVVSGTISAQGNIELGSPFDGGSTALVINGGSDQTFIGSSTSTVGDCLPVNINKGSGSLILSGTIRSGNNWTYTAGSIDPGVSTVIFAIRSLTITGNMTFGNLTFNRGTIFTVESATSLTTNGTLTLTDGSVNSGTINAIGNISLGSAFDGGSTVLNINGTGNQTFNGTCTLTSGRFLPLDINKTSGVLTLSGTIRTHQNWTYTSGTVDAGTSTVVFGSSALTIDGSMGFYNVTFNSTTIFTISTDTKMTVNGILGLNYGTINAETAGRGTIETKGDVAVAQTASVAGNAILSFAGSADQQVTCSGTPTARGNLLQNVVVEKSDNANRVSITGNVYVHNINVNKGSLLFLGGSTYTFHNADTGNIATITVVAGATLDFSGSSGSMVTLRSSVNNRQWKLNVDNAATCNATYVDVKDSDASGGKTIMATSSTNSGNNKNWSFPSMLAFTTSSQHVVKNVSSSVINFQLQDGSGTASTLSSTTRINLTTTSSTGTFSSSSFFSDVITYVTVAAGTYSGSFYYKDSTPGTYTLTVSESPSQGWTAASQSIYIDNAGTSLYKREITITAGTVLTDYQVLITVDTQEMVDDHSPYVRADGSDIRFYDSDELTALSFWIEDDTMYSTATRIWVKVPEVTVPTKKIYMYYGSKETTVVSASDVTNTFIFGDDFLNATTFNNVKWNTSAAGPVFSISSGTLKGINTGTTAASGRLQSQTRFTAPFVLESSVKVNAIPSSGLQTLGVYASSTDGLGLLCLPSGNPTRYNLRNDGVWAGSVNTGSIFSGWHYERVTAADSGNAVQIYLNRPDTSQTSTRSVTNVISNEPITIGKRYDNAGGNQTYEAYWNWIFVRKYASTEPTVNVSTIEGTVITHLEFTTQPQTIVQNKTSTLMSIQTHDVNGNPVAVSSDTSIFLESDPGPSGNFAPEDDPSNWSSDNTRTLIIPAGSYQVSFYYKNSQVGTYTIKADETPDVGWSGTTQEEKIISAINTFLVEATSPIISGQLFSLKLTAIDVDGQIATGYAGTADLSVNYVSPGTGGGVLSVTSVTGFVNGIATVNESFSDCGVITIKAADSEDPTKSGTSNNLDFRPYDFTVVPSQLDGESSGTAGTHTVMKQFTLTITARNTEGTTCPNYKGEAVLSVDYLSPLTNQGGSLSVSTIGSTYWNSGIASIDDLTYDKWGKITITANDAAITTQKGTSSEVLFIPKDFLVGLSTPPASRTYYYLNEDFSSDVTVRDQNGGTVTNYQGTIKFSGTSLDLPNDYTFVSADSGTHKFTGINGNYEDKTALTVKDSAYASVAGVSSDIVLKDGTIQVLAASGPVGSVSAQVKLIDKEGSILLEDNSTTFTIKLTEFIPGDNSASSSSETVPVQVSQGLATIVVTDTAAESVTVTPASTPELNSVAGTVRFGTVSGSGVGIQLFREIEGREENENKE